MLRSVGGNGHCWGERDLVQPLGGHFGDAWQNFVYLPSDPTIPFLRIYPKMCNCTHSCDYLIYDCLLDNKLRGAKTVWFTISTPSAYHMGLIYGRYLVKYSLK